MYRSSCLLALAQIGLLHLLLHQSVNQNLCRRAVTCSCCRQLISAEVVNGSALQQTCCAAWALSRLSIAEGGAQKSLFDLPVDEHISSADMWTL